MTPIKKNNEEMLHLIFKWHKATVVKIMINLLIKIIWLRAGRLVESPPHTMCTSQSQVG
jgi:hypothetical protein